MLTVIKKNNSSGFTLVELAIVLVIIGFLMALISGGSSLMKTAELTSVVADFKNFQNTYGTFYNRYSGAPGDIVNADTLWTNCSSGGTTCNGSGDGMIDSALGSQAAWRELYLSGLLAWNIAQVGATAATATISGTSAGTSPGSKTSGAGYTMINGTEALFLPSFVGYSGLWATGAGTSTINAVFIGKPNATMLNYSAYSAQDAYSIDRKIDDGVASTGIIRGADGFDVTGTNRGTSKGCITSSGGNYMIANSVIACVVGIAMNN